MCFFACAVGALREGPPFFCVLLRATFGTKIDHIVTSTMDGLQTCRSEQIDSNRPSQASPLPSTTRRPPPSTEPSPSAVHLHPPPRPAEASNASTAVVRPPPSPKPSVIHLTPDRPLLRLPTGTNTTVKPSNKKLSHLLKDKTIVGQRASFEDLGSLQQQQIRN